MTCRFVLKTLTSAVVFVVFTDLLINFGQGFPVLNIANAQENSVNDSIDSNTSQRLIFKSPEGQDYSPANQISVTTDKPNYNQGEIVNVTIANEGTQPLHFSAASSEVIIKDLKTDRTFVPSVLLSNTLIPSGSSKTISWNEHDYNGIQVRPGNYTVQVSVGSLKDNATFSIE